MADYPCDNCTKVECPEKCINKCCPEWKAWFLERWEEINNFGRKYAKKKRRQNV